MNIASLTSFIVTLTAIESGILNNYDTASDTIKSGLIQAVIDDNSVGFSKFVMNLGWDATSSDILFEFIQSTAAPQLGPGLAFGQFERRSQWQTNDIFQVMELENQIFSKNINLDTNHGGIRFMYSGIYKVSVQFRQAGPPTEWGYWSRVQFRGLVSDIVVGRSVLALTGFGVGSNQSTNGLNSFSFLINIGDVSDIYLLELARQNANIDSFTLHFVENVFGVDDTELDANIVLVVEYIGQL